MKRRQILRSLNTTTRMHYVNHREQGIRGKVYSLLFLYFRGRCAELIGYWKVLKYDASKIGDCYYDFIKMMEKGRLVVLLYYNVMAGKIVLSFNAQRLSETLALLFPPSSSHSAYLYYRLLAKHPKNVYSRSWLCSII